jgi:hypothetical protein
MTYLENEHKIPSSSKNHSAVVMWADVALVAEQQTSDKDHKAMSEVM